MPTEEKTNLLSDKETRNKFYTKSISQIAEILDSLKAYLSNRYYNSNPVISIQIPDPNVELDFYLQDLLLTGAFSQSSVLLAGSSGTGKTYLCELVSYFLFGQDGYTRKNITPDMNEQDFMDIDFGAIKAGKKLKEAIIADQLLFRPCLIIDEPNRAPPLIQNRLMQILENNIDLKSKTIQAGIPLADGSYYHWNLLTLNAGEEYAGTNPIDRALQDRITINIPIDNFPPTIDDQISMIREVQIPLIKKEPKPELQTALDIYRNLGMIDISLEAEAFILYLSFCSACVKSTTQSKYGIIFSPQFCKEHDCQYARNPPLNEICPFTFAPSNRILRRLVEVAKCFSLIKNAKIYKHILETEGKKAALKYISNQELIEVSINDVISIAPFVINYKMGMISEWVFNNFNGNSFLACQHFLKVINKQLINFMHNVLGDLLDEIKGKSLTEKQIGNRNKEVKKDFHYDGLIKYVRKYLVG